MKNHLSFKRLPFITLILSLLTLAGYLFLMLCVDHGFGVETIVGVVKPIGAFALVMVLFSFIFLFFPEVIFKLWLKRIAWWYGLGLLIITANTPVLSSNVLAVDRSQIVFGGMVILAVITLPFIVIMRRRLKA
ncbi:hypothetical protein H6784_02560 [Candidatus Nomurabacteria bacterium]|nr:hypothetical protein [Candidatus Kaiserbacteria bacterium]MCB9814279.1 hypothetical protein [Candidatus Nomurabacteria bacterium]